jgi:hypothetical protein
MAVPARQRGNRFATVGAAPILTSPEIQQGFTSFERGGHLESQALLKIELPLWVVGIGLAVDLGVSFDGETMSLKQVNGL